MSENQCTKTIILRSNEYLEHTEKNTTIIKEITEEQSSELMEYIFHSLSQVLAWKEIQSALIQVKNCRVLFDTSTSPREIIWYILFFLKSNNCHVDIYYSKPTSYGKWLSKDPGKPRLIYNHSGLTDLDKPTALLLVTGFDIERAGQLIRYFEPKVTFLALQKGEQYNNHKINIENHLNVLQSHSEIQHFFFDCFSNDGGYKAIKEWISMQFKLYNIVATTLGPKPSTIALFKLQQQFEEMALCYIPSKQYNTESYSSGIKETYKIDF